MSDKRKLAELDDQSDADDRELWITRFMVAGHSREEAEQKYDYINSITEGMDGDY